MNVYCTFRVTQIDENKRLNCNISIDKRAALSMRIVSYKSTVFTPNVSLCQKKYTHFIRINVEDSSLLLCLEFCDLVIRY